MRLDRALVTRGLCRSRTEAQTLIHEGAVTVGGVPILKASLEIGEGAALAVADRGPRPVSRGGLKLATALDGFAIPVAGRAALDVGASTGGFTECLLHRGAASVHAVDVGHGQMVPHLAADPRVRSREGVNARFLSPADFPHPFDLVVADMSFISLTLVLPALAPYSPRTVILSAWSSHSLKWVWTGSAKAASCGTRGRGRTPLPASPPTPTPAGWPSGGG